MAVVASVEGVVLYSSATGRYTVPLFKKRYRVARGRRHTQWFLRITTRGACHDGEGAGMARWRRLLHHCTSCGVHCAQAYHLTPGTRQGTRDALMRVFACLWVDRSLSCTQYFTGDLHNDCRARGCFCCDAELGRSSSETTAKLHALRVRVRTRFAWCRRFRSLCRSRASPTANCAPRV